MRSLQLNDEELFAHYKMNLQAILPHSKNLDELALNSIQQKRIQINNFENRISFCAQQAAIGKKSFSTYFNNWSSSAIKDIVDERGGLLCGLFHFGAHRHFFLDTMCEGIDTVAPIAGEAYTDMQRLAKSGTNKVSDRILLLEVEGDKVGRNLFKALRSGRVGGIYVDGNMGPSSTVSSDDCVNVNFFEKTLKVKAGIARLSLLLQLPILPVFCSGNISNREIKFGELIKPPKKTSLDKNNYLVQAMQALYFELQEQVKESPEDWEYALCLHRWIDSVESNLKGNHSTSRFTFISVNTKNTSLLIKDTRLVIVNTQRGKGFNVPEELTNILGRLFKIKKCLGMNLKQVLKSTTIALLS
ncbi:hypothetical protein P4S66_08900 [Pseudoalteromonas sp. B129b]